MVAMVAVCAAKAITKTAPAVVAVAMAVAVAAPLMPLKDAHIYICE